MEKVSLGALAVVLVLAIYSLFVCLLQFAWNAAVVPTFGAPVLSFWQTWGCMMIVGFVGACFKSINSSN